MCQSTNDKILHDIEHEKEDRAKRPERRRFHQCKICNKENSNRAELMAHLRDAHPDADGPPLALASLASAPEKRQPPPSADPMIVKTADGRRILLHPAQSLGTPTSIQGAAGNFKVMMVPKSKLSVSGPSVVRAVVPGTKTQQQQQKQQPILVQKPTTAPVTNSVKIHTYAATGTPDMVLTKVDKPNVYPRVIAPAPAGVSSATLNGVSLDGMPKITSISTNSEAFFGRDPSKKERDREKDLPCTPSGRRARTNFTWAQIQVLSEYFKKSNYVQRDDVALLMEKTGLLERNIRVWFQNRRNQYDRAYEGKLAQHRQ